MSIEKKPGRLAQHALVTPIKAFINSRSVIEIERNDTIGLKPPYVIISNHVNNWDPLFLNCYVDEPICYIAGEPLFRNPFLKHILNYAGAIRKTKFTNDTTTIRNVIKAKKHNRVIGIFPEGNRNWDGVNEPIIYSTAKLVKLLNIPVVVAKIKGGHLSHPRWGDGHRKGKIQISFEKHWADGDLKNLSVDEVYEKLTDAMFHDEVDWQQHEMNTYKAKNPAHYLERLLYICPHCQTPGFMHSVGDLFFCKSCQYKVRYTAYGNFESTNLPIHYETPRDWKNWQSSILDQYFDHPDWQNSWADCLKDPINLYVSKDKKPFELIGTGKLTWNHYEFIFKTEQETLSFQIKHADGVNIQFHHKLDFLYDDDFYRMVFYEPRSSAYKWLQVAKQIQKETSSEPRGVTNG
ncbi:lysophospholipid acyltransferase family protein [Aquisalibacillus elongatus]|uniref:1-acyl-sn-glycerol-3-phosphate acyltransferase n=1 Tax=Aquisalibacillus elongatus TaxID=485577 RepID=A0A3N5BUJ3_9BACI|nr:lysophospholipid acyltransferase family protein [Aquisalibacillus elongatus]RPF51062.1 1-acyl-sn-glycerol-3-phosphate acyltransferase [Aquisalibacillus elongatus]